MNIKIQGTIDIFCDNQSAINIAHNAIQNDRTKHIEIDRHFIKKKLDAGIIRIPYVSSESQVVDVLTKRLAAKGFEVLISKLGMIDIHSPA